MIKTPQPRLCLFEPNFIPVGRYFEVEFRPTRWLKLQSPADGIAEAKRLGIHAPVVGLHDGPLWERPKAWRH